MSASTKIDRESSTHARLDKEMEQPQRQRRRLGRSHREATPVQPPEPDPYPPDPSPQMVRMQIRPPGSLSAHESKILRRRDKTFASASARSQSQPREAEKLSSPDAHQLIKHRSLSSPRHKEESSESELTTGSSSQQRAVAGLGQKHDTLTRLEQNLQRFEDERRRFEADKRIFEREKREHKLRNRQQLDNEERKRLLQSYRKLSDRIQLPQDEEERRRLIHSLRLQRHEAPKGRVRNRSSGYEESSTQFSSSDAETAEEVHRRTRVQKTPQGYVAAPIRGAPPPPPSAVPKPPERRSVSRNNSLSPVRPQRRSKTPEQREEIIRKLEYVEVGESRDEVVKPRATEAEQQSDLMRKYMEAAERAAKAEAALAAQSLAVEGVRRSNSLRLAEKEEKPSKSEAKRSSSLERPLRANRSASLERNAPKEEVIPTPEEHEDPEPELETEEKEDIPSAPEDYSPEAKTKPTFLERLKGLFRRKKKIPKEEVIVDVTTKPLPEKLVSRAFLYHLRLEARHEWRRLKLDYPQRVEEMRLIRNKCVSHCICLAMLLGFGGLMFRYTEGASEDIYKCQVRKVKRDFIDNLWDVSHNMREDDWKSLARQKLRKFEDELNTLAELGLRRFPGQRSWNFVNCFIFCWTVITTIGYGHITPKTPLGRSLTIIYAIIGIPVFLIVLADLGKLFTRSVKFLWAYVRRLYYTRSCRRIRKQQQIRDAMTGINTVYDFAIRRPSKYFGNSGEDNEENNAEADAEAGRSLATSHPETPTSPYPETFEVDDEFNLPISVATLLLVSYMLLGTFCYRILEDWPLLDSFYYMFISMSTIGFGDLVPTNPIYMMVSMIYLIFGLALTSMFINVVQIKLSDHFKHASAKVGATIGMNMASEFGDETGSQAKTPSELASVHGSRLDRIEEDGQEGNGGAASPPPPPPTSILRAPRPLSPVSNASADNVSPPPLLPRRQVSVEPQPQDAVENKKKKKHRFF
ncbi:uncharacterized protein [Drosophila bipectinata]|uniref:uncharacterized protein isoform X1 n=1 Tax=Drosophila bipectinata TaxID=42026 RepID=UPI001C894A32|nr:uncharacterized protein LOC108122520 isoform X1 [Drosophila bipectinata]